MRTVRSHSRYVPEATRKEGMQDLAPNQEPGTPPSGDGHFFGVKVAASVFHVVSRRAVSHAADFAVYISA